MKVSKKFQERMLWVWGKLEAGTKRNGEITDADKISAIGAAGFGVLLIAVAGGLWIVGGLVILVSAVFFVLRALINQSNKESDDE